MRATCHSSRHGNRHVSHYGLRIVRRTVGASCGYFDERPSQAAAADNPKIIYAKKTLENQCARGCLLRRVVSGQSLRLPHNKKRNTSGLLSGMRRQRTLQTVPKRSSTLLDSRAGKSGASNPQGVAAILFRARTRTQRLRQLETVQ
jgi:hypothetical protein